VSAIDPADAVALRNLMTQTGLNGAELAAKAGVSPSTISRALSGERGLGRKTMRKFEAAALGLGVGSVSSTATLVEHVQREAVSIGIAADSPAATVTQMRIAIERLRALLEGR
jgi:transcriptional regulator with XRE-family HTH domain